LGAHNAAHDASALSRRKQAQTDGFCVIAEPRRSGRTHCQLFA
jgi:hypothetical protein